MHSNNRILVVEDDFLISACLKDFLVSEGYDVTTVATCRDARQIIADGRPYDMITIDVTLPDGDGIALGREIAQGHPHLPIVYTTGHLLDEGALSYQEGYVSKPYAYEALLEELEKVSQAARATSGY